jgi:regulator of ribonuclease activity A
MGEVGVSLQFGSMTVNNGDFIYADNNGMIVSQKALI